MPKKIQPGTYVKVSTGGNRIRHARVTAVASQDSITARLGTPETSASATFTATRIASTKTRGTIFRKD